MRTEPSLKVPGPQREHLSVLWHAGDLEFLAGDESIHPLICQTRPRIGSGPIHVCIIAERGGLGPESGAPPL